MLKAFICSVSFIAMTGVALAQSTGGISGTIQDPSGAAIANARIALSNLQTSGKRETESGSGGEYSFSLLPPGLYQLVVERVGFRRTIQEGLSVAVNQTQRVNFVLPVGQLSEEIHVTDRLPLIENTTSSRGQVLDGSTVTELPLNVRNFLAFTLLVPGVQPPADGSFNSSQGLSVSVNGAREEANNFMLDGVDNNDMSTNLISALPSLEAVQEFKVQASVSSAEYGRNAGAQVNVILKSGGNDTHGSVFGYVRNRHLDAKNFFDLPDCGRTSQSGACGEIPRFDRQQFGGAVGGPLVRDRTFFFAAYEGLQLRQAVTRRATVPSLAQRSTAVAATPATERNSAGLALLNFIPLSNVGPNLTTSNTFLAAPTLSDEIHEFSLKIDHSAGSSNTLSGHYALTEEDRFNPFDLLFPFTNLPGFGSSNDNRAQSARISWTHVFSPRMIGEFRAGFNRMRGAITHQNSGTSISRQLGFPDNSIRPIDVGAPNVILAGFDAVGEPTNLPQKRVANTFQFNGNIAWNPTAGRSRHHLKMGSDIRRIQWNVFLDLYARGQWTFLGGGSGNPLIDLVRGRPDFAIAGRGNTDLALRTSSWNFYFQDDFQLSKRLTLNAGLRYEYNSPAGDIRQRLSGPDLTPASQTCAPRPTCQFFSEGTNGVPRGIYHKDLNNFAPRVGFAWQPFASDKFVLRSAYGIFYDSGVFNRSLLPRFNPPFFEVGVFVNDGGRTIQDILQTGTVIPSLGLTLAQDLRDAYMQQWNLGVQYQVKRDWVLDAAYVGSKGTHLLGQRDLNQPRPGPGPRPYPGFGSFRHVESNSASNYNSLQMRSEWRLHRGLNFLSSYTWSRAIDNASALVVTLSEPTFPQDSYNTRADKSLSTFHAAHRMSLSGTYRMPFAKGRKRSVFLADWEIGGIFTVQSGRPFTVNRAIPQSATSADFGVFDRPDAIADPFQPGPVLTHPDPACRIGVSAGGRAPERVRTANFWFNPCAFAAPSTPRFGTAGRNSVIGPPLANVDLLLRKNIAFAEKSHMEVRAEFFNVLNHPNFDIPDRIFDSPTFGSVLSSNAFGSKPPRQIQLGLKYTF